MPPELLRTFVVTPLQKTGCGRVFACMTAKSLGDGLV
jgi:hypothetical protein